MTLRPDSVIAERNALRQERDAALDEYDVMQKAAVKWKARAKAAEQQRDQLRKALAELEWSGINGSYEEGSRRPNGSRNKERYRNSNKS